MKKISLFLALVGITVISFGQQEIFDLATFTPPKAWKKQAAESAISYSTEDAAKGTYAVITLFKAVPGTTNSKENFDLAWTGVVKEMVTVAVAPEMQAPVSENGWEAQSGFAPFESEGQKGIVVLVTSSGFNKMVNIIIMTNTDAYEKEMTDFLSSVSLTKPAGDTREPSPPVAATPPPSNPGGFTFTTTNFDDGWTSTVMEDWVQVTRGNVKVLIHHPNKSADTYNSVLMDGLKNAWNVLVAPKYSTASNFEFKPISNWESIEFAEADAVEKATGKTVHVVLFKRNYSGGNGRYLEFITPGKADFEREFGAYHETSYGWENLEKMASYNKFAVSAADLTGKWSSNFSGAIQYVNAYTGYSAGMDTHASVENFQIGPGNSYKWDLGVASGQVGNIKFQSVKSTGKFSMKGNWQVTFSDIEGKPRTYNVQFSCIKGLRILWLDDKGFAKVE